MELPTSSFSPGSAAATASTVELSVSCRKLLDMDVFSKSDPMCVLFLKEFAQNKWNEVGRTETIDNTLNPDFVKKFVLNYFFEERQYLRFEVYDIDSRSHDLSKHDFLGKMECTLGEVVSATKLERRLDGPKANAGSIISVIAEELAVCKEEVTLHFAGKKLDKKKFFGKSNPFLAFYRVNEDSSYTVMHRTEVIRKNLNPQWRPFTVPVRKLCSGDYSRSILIKCIDWNKNGREDLIGEFTTNMSELAAHTQGHTWEITKKHTNAKKKSKVSGHALLLSAKIQTCYTFIDHIQQGTQLNCTIAIDFTASNGTPTQPDSLHYINPQMPNQYARALRAVGEIIQDYDSDKLFPVLGFGARLPPDGHVSHEFFVNLDQHYPFCEGINGVLEAYHKCLYRIQLSGPTNFAPVINHVARFAAAKRDGSEYFILLIITDGIITDMPQTKEAIVQAAVLPLSIIIVGVGQANFDAMNELDSDYVRLSFQGRFADRDIVQFVPFRDFISSTYDMNVSQARLAKEVLAEIPDQFLSYMKVNNVIPGSWNRGRTASAPTGGPSNRQPVAGGGSLNQPSPSSSAPPPYPGC